MHDDWDSLLVFLLAGEGGGDCDGKGGKWWILAITTLICIILLLWHYFG